MIRIKKIYNLIKVCEIYYEQIEVIRDFLKNNSFIATRIFSYEPLALPNFAIISEKKTTRIILPDKSDEEILASFKKNYRNEIRKTYNDSRYSFVIQEGFSSAGYQLYKAFEVESQRPYLKESAATGVWVLGYIDEELVSGIYLTDLSPVLKVVAIFSARKEMKEETISPAMIGYLSKRLMYEVCQFATKSGFFCVDLAYVNIASEERIGITMYKLGFGGDVVTEYIYENNSPVKSILKRLRKKVRI
jgi:hypothetical protein